MSSFDFIFSVFSLSPIPAIEGNYEDEPGSICDGDELDGILQPFKDQIAGHFGESLLEFWAIFMCLMFRRSFLGISRSRICF